MKFSHWNTAITSRPEWRAVCKTVCTDHLCPGTSNQTAPCDAWWYIPYRTWFPSAGKAFEPDLAHIDHRSDTRREADDTLWNVSTNNIPSGRVVPDGCWQLHSDLRFSTDGIQLNNDDVIEHPTARNIVGALHTRTS